MLLGPKKKNALRKSCKRQLEGLGFTNIVLMEDMEGEEAEELDAKFARTIKDTNPVLYVFLFPLEANMDAVIFELGWLCGKLGSKKLGKKIRILYEYTYDFRKTTGYIRAILPRAIAVPYNQKARYESVSFHIQTWARGLSRNSE